MSSILLDLAAVAVLIICAAVYARKGFLASVVVFVGTLAAIFFATLIADKASPAVFEKFFQQGLEERTVQAIGQQSAENLSELLRSVLSFLPQATVDSIVDNFGLSVDFAASDIASQIVQEIIAPLVIPIISIIVFFVVFALLRLLLSMINALLKSVRRVPVVGTVNTALGAAIGIFIGALYVFLIMCVIWGLDTAYGGGLSRDVFGTSVIFKLLQPFNIFT